MTIQETLLEMRYLMGRRKRLKDDMDRAMGAATSSGGLGDGLPRAASTESRVERYGTYCADLQRQIDNIDAKLNLYREDIKPLIEAVPTGPEKESLRRRYIDLMTVSEAARSMNYERESMYRLIKKSEEKWIF